MPHPDQDDVVVRRKRGNPGAIFVLGTPPAPDQFTLRTRDEAAAQALAFAKPQRVGAWFTNGGDELVLLGTFRQQTGESAGDVLVTRKNRIKASAVDNRARY
jgi:hypothetical protein